jgi:Gluconate 2-dehydrogenase subunit 3
MTTRREALKIIGAVGATCAFPFSANELYGQHVHPGAMAPPKDVEPTAAFEPRFFLQMELPVIARIADLIIPPTETPGASAAGVPEYIDLVVSQNPKLQLMFREGLLGLDKAGQSRFAGSTFLKLTEPQQVEILTSLSEATGSDAAFFGALKGLTADGYYTSRAGLVQELGYNGNDYLAAFPEFRIAEH